MRKHSFAHPSAWEKSLGGVNEGGIPRKWGIRACCTQASPLIAEHCTLLTSQLTQYRLESTCAATVCQLSGSHTSPCVNSLTSPALQLIAPSLFCPVGNGMVSHQNMLMMPNSNICVTQKSRTWCFTLDKLDSPFALVSDHGISHYNDIAPNVNLCVQLAILAKFQYSFKIVFSQGKTKKGIGERGHNLNLKRAFGSCCLDDLIFYKVGSWICKTCLGWRKQRKKVCFRFVPHIMFWLAQIDFGWHK